MSRSRSEQNTMKTGLDVLRDADFAPLRGKRVGLVTHPAALDSQLRSAMELFAERVNLVALFGPEHGITGEAQDLIPVAGAREGPVRVHSLYGDTFDSLKPTPAMLDGLDVLVIDLVDIGSRYYTFQATMLYCMEACAAVGLPVVILDRQNPLGRTVEGPTIQSGFESFVGVHPICTRHGMTMGELAKLYQAERVPTVNLTVIPCDWPDVYRIETRFWLPPSPNMPTGDTALVYPGMCLIEGTNLSEGRGTTRPFEYVGHPHADGRTIAEAVNANSFPGFRCLPVSFRPTFQKHAGQTCGGVMLAVTDPWSYRAVKTGLLLLCAFRDHLGDTFRWRTERYEFVEHIPAIDLLFGSNRERLAIEAGVKYWDIIAPWKAKEAAFRERRRPFLLYQE